MTALGRKGDDHVSIYVDIPLSRRVVQLQRRTLLAVVDVVVPNDGGQNDVHLLTRKVHADEMRASCQHCVSHEKTGLDPQDPTMTYPMQFLVPLAKPIKARSSRGLSIHRCGSKVYGSSKTSGFMWAIW